MRSWRSIASIAAGLAFFAHLFGNPHYGFHSDELYFIMCGFRPAWGYVDQPPLTPLLAAGSQFFGHSLILLRALPACFSAASVFLTCLLVVELGGGAFAQVFAALVAFLCPVLMIFGVLLSTDMVGLAMWPLVALCCLRAAKGGHPGYWLLAGAAIGISFEAKYSVLFFAIALLAGLLMSPQRRALLSPWCFAGIAVAVAFALPNILWQLHYGLPMLELLRNGQAWKNVILNPLEFMAAQLLITNPLLATVWIAGFIWLIRNPTARFLAWTFVVLIAQMVLLHGKHYYPANVYPILIAAGGVAIETWTSSRRALRPALLGLCTLGGLVLVPYFLPILPVERLIALNERIGSYFLNTRIAKTDNYRDGLLPPEWARMHGWPELTDTIAKVYEALPQADRAQAVIATENYGEAAALEFFGAKRGLPTVISKHNQYFLWGTHGKTGEVLIHVNGDCGEPIHLYRSSEVAAVFSHPYVMPYENQIPIRVCRGLNRPLSEVWPHVKDYH